MRWSGPWPKRWRNLFRRVPPSRSSIWSELRYSPVSCGAWSGSGGFGGKSDTLAANEVYGGSPDTYKKYFRYLEEATPEDLREAAREWLSDGDFILEVHPFPEYSTADSGADRDRLPDVGEPPPAEFPRLQKATLSSGLKVILAERHAVPIINFRLLMDAGYAADLGGLAGTANLTADMMDEGTSTRSALEISEEAAPSRGQHRQ